MIHSFSHLVNSLPQLIADGGYWILSFIVLLEGMPVIGSLLPGHVAIISAGFLAKLGILKLGPVLFVSIISAIIGDLVGFFLGQRYGDSLLQKFFKKIFIRQEHIEKAKRLIDNHTGKAIIFGKFTPVTRSLMPFLVGASGIHVKKFWLYNLLGAIAWVTSSVFIGYIFGLGYPLIAKFLGKFIVIAIIGGILIVWGYRFVNIRFHIFKKYELFVLGLNLLALFALAKTVQDSLSANSFMVNFDIATNLFMQKLTDSLPMLINWAKFVSMAGGTVVMIAIGFLIGITLLLKKKWRRAIIMIASVGLTAAALSILKEVFMRVRPENALQILTDPSFPSGHAGLSAAFFVAFAYITLPQLGSWVKREVLIVVCFLIVFAVGLSRLVLNVHWASDVLAGYALGIFIATSTILLVRYIGTILYRNFFEQKSIS